jgi:hypothetical protein
LVHCEKLLTRHDRARLGLAEYVAEDLEPALRQLLAACPAGLAAG